MLPKKHRITRKDGFKNIYRSSRSYTSGIIVLTAKKNNLDRTRLAAVAGIKFSKKAVARNRIKRQIREIMHRQLSSLPAGWDMVVSVRRTGNSQENYKSRELQEMIKIVLKKLV